MKRLLASFQKKLGKVYIPIVFFLFSLVLFTIMYSNVKPMALDVQLYQVAEETIRANATVEDVERTEESRRSAAESVQDVYTYNAELDEIQVGKIEVFFAMINEVNEEADAEYQEALEAAEEELESSSSESSSEPAAEPLTTEEKRANFESKLSAADEPLVDFIDSIPTWVIEDLLESNEATLERIETATSEIVAQAMSEQIRAEQVSSVVQEAASSLDYMDLSGNYQRIASVILDNAIIENNIYDEEATLEMREEAMRNVQPALILQGQVIVQEGHVVDSTVMQQLDLLGLLDMESSYYTLFGLILLISAQICVLFYLGLSVSKDRGKRGNELTLYSLLFVVALVIMRVLQLIQSANVDYIGLLYPAALVPSLLSAFLSRRYGIVANGFLAAFSIFIFYGESGTSLSIVMALFYFLSGMMGTIHPKSQNADKLWKPFLWMIASNLLFILSFVLYLNISILSSSFFWVVIYAFSSGLLSHFLSIILSPYVEVLYADNAVLTLIELGNPNSPLLKQLVTKAPGTYHHSLMVANLSANAVGEIGGNSMFARVACYYHDVGKLRHSLFFVENLPGGMENPHNMLSPKESADIIFGHVSEGVKMLEEYKLPQSIIDICAQHHGTTLMKFFYAKAKEADETVKENEFRYPGPKPQTKEAAVINIADSAEAAVRSMPNPTKETIESFVRKLINDRISDGQFNECDVTLKELKIVERSICEGLNGTFHSRIEYPNLSKNEE